MAFSWTFNGIEMSQYLSATDVVRNVGQNRNANLTTVGHAPGKIFNYVEIDEGTISVTGTVPHLDAAKRRAAAAALSTDEPAQLIFSDEPDKYYEAICNNQTGLSETFERGTITITFTVPDGLAYSVDLLTGTSSDGTTIALPYKGTAPAYPVVTFTMTGDNGYIGLANDNGGALEFGDPEESDTESGTRSDKPIRWGFNAAPTDIVLNQSIVTPYPNRINDSRFPNTPDGSYKYANEIATPVFGSNNHNVWHGPALHGAIAANYAGNGTGDFQFAQRLNFTSNYKNSGRMEMTLESGGKPAFTAILRDSSNKSSTRYFECWAGTKLLKSYALPGAIGNSFLEIAINRNGDALSFRIAEIAQLKAGNVSHIWNNWRWQTTIAGSSNTTVDGLTLWCERIGTDPVNEMSWSDTKFTWVNEQYLDDVPNRWESGDKVTIDIPNRQVFVNGVQSDLMTVGNDWDSFAMSKPMTIQPIISSWAQPAAVTAQVREAYL